MTQEEKIEEIKTAFNEAKKVLDKYPRAFQLLYDTRKGFCLAIDIEKLK